MLLGGVGPGIDVHVRMSFPITDRHRFAEPVILLVFEVALAMRNRAQLLLLLIAVVSGSLTGCFAKPLNLNITRMGPPYQIVAYDHGQPVGGRDVVALSSEEQVIARWLEANRRGWRPSLGNHPPGRIIKGEGFTLNFTENLCILNIPPDPHANGTGKGKTEPIILQKRLTPGDLELSALLNSGL